MSSGSSSYRGSEQIVYAFIDGNYVRERQNIAMNEVFGVPGELAPEVIPPANVFRAYFYDCIDDKKMASESEAEFKSRLELQDETFSRMHSRAGLHLRLGTLKYGRRRSQKEVDILLAVDMLTHGLNRNMTHAILISGDLDFRPVVEALVRGGVFVEVWYEKRTVAKELPGAADFGAEISWHQLYNWNTQSFKQKHQPPSHSMGHQPVINAKEAVSGTSEGRPASMLKVSDEGPFILRAERSDGVHWFEHSDRQVLDRYYSMLFGPIEWK